MAREKSSLSLFVFNVGLLILYADYKLFYYGDIISEKTGRGLIGFAFLTLATTLPELVVSISSLKFAADMAVGNILGANFLDIMIVPVCDLFFRRGEFLSCLAPEHTLTLLLGMILTSIVIVGLIYRSRKSFLKLGWDIIAMIVTFVMGGYLLIRLM